MEQKTLLGLARQKSELERELFDLGGELLNESHESEFEAAIKELTSGIATKVDNYAFLIKDLERSEQLFDEVIEKMKARKKAITTTITQLETRAKIAMAELNASELQGEYNKFKLSAPTQSVEILNDGEITMKFIREKIVLEPDKKLIKEALLAGEVVSGARLKESRALRITYSPKPKLVGKCE